MLDPSVVRLLSAVDVTQAVRSVELTVGQIARLCGVTPRQIFYWAEKGIISGTKRPGRAMTYDMNAVEKVLMVRTLLDAGYALEAASALVTQFLSAGTAAQDRALTSDGACPTGEGERVKPSDEHVREPAPVWDGRRGPGREWLDAAAIGQRLARLEQAVFGPGMSLVRSRGERLA